jgi:hypothetical protein
VKLEFYPINDIEQRTTLNRERLSLVKYQVVVLLLIHEEFGVVNSCFSIFESSVFVSICFLSFIEEFGKDQVPVRELRGFRLVVVEEEEVVCEFEYSGEGQWGYTHEVVAKVMYFVHQCWQIPISGVIGQWRACGWNVFLV